MSAFHFSSKIQAGFMLAHFYYFSGSKFLTQKFMRVTIADHN